MLKIWCINVFLLCNVVKKIGVSVVWFLSFNLADLNWPEEQSSSIRYLWSHLLYLCKLFFKSQLWNILPCKTSPFPIFPLTLSQAFLSEKTSKTVLFHIFLVNQFQESWTILYIKSIFLQCYNWASFLWNVKPVYLVRESDLVEFIFWLNTWFTSPKSWVKLKFLKNKTLFIFVNLCYCTESPE